MPTPHNIVVRGSGSQWYAANASSHLVLTAPYAIVHDIPFITCKIGQLLRYLLTAYLFHTSLLLDQTIFGAYLGFEGVHFAARRHLKGSFLVLRFSNFTGG